MANPVTDLLESINHEVAKLSTVGLSRLTSVLDDAEVELTRALSKWSLLGNGDDRFTPQMYRSALVQVRGALTHIRGPLAEGVASTLRHGGTVAAHLATAHLTTEVQAWSSRFEGTVRSIPIEAASVLAEGKAVVWKRFANSAKRYAGQVGEDIQKQLAIGVVRGETVDQLTKRLSKLGGASGEGTDKAELISEGLFRRYRHFAERLVVTETVNAYNEFAMVGMDELEKEDPGYFKRWDAAVDKRTCDQCGRYDDIVVPLNKTFPGGLSHPPLHPRCRCAQVVWRKEWDESNYKDDLVKETVKGKHKEGIASIPHTIDVSKLAPPKEEKKPKKNPKESKPLTPAPTVSIEPKVFKTLEKDDLFSWYDRQASKVTSQEKLAFDSYQQSAYRDMNGQLRGKEKFKGDKKKEVDDLIKNLEAGIQKSKALDDILVYRGGNTNIIGDMKAGDTFTDKAFLSTSINKGASEAFIERGGNHFTIEVPKGYPISPMMLPNRDLIDMEEELLLPRDVKMNIISIEERKGIKYIKVRIVE